MCVKSGVILGNMCNVHCTYVIEEKTQWEIDHGFFALCTPLLLKRKNKENHDKWHFITKIRRACGFQNLVGTSAYGGRNLYRPGFNRVKVAAKTLWGPVLMSPCPQAHLNTVLLINNNRRYFLPS